MRTYLAIFLCLAILTACAEDKHRSEPKPCMLPEPCEFTFKDSTGKEYKAKAIGVTATTVLLASPGGKKAELPINLIDKAQMLKILQAVVPKETPQKAPEARAPAEEFTLRYGAGIEACRGLAKAIPLALNKKTPPVVLQTVVVIEAPDTGKVPADRGWVIKKSAGPVTISVIAIVPPCGATETDLHEWCSRVGETIGSLAASANGANMRVLVAAKKEDISSGAPALLQVDRDHLLLGSVTAVPGKPAAVTVSVFTLAAH